MNILSETVEYSQDKESFSGLIAYDADKKMPLPAVMIVHMWGGRNEFVDNVAIRLAELGYAGFCVDLYGTGKRGTSIAECSALMQPFLDDRTLLQKRMELSLATMSQQKQVDSTRMAAIGYCFGGLCVLDLARSGVKMAGVVSFHGLLKPAGHLTNIKIQTPLLILHGDADPMAPPQDVQSLREELNDKQAEWQIHIYGNTVHAFTNPAANDRQRGTVYQPVADKRSWQAMKNFLEEIF